jgi:hypothetical protein
MVLSGSGVLDAWPGGSALPPAAVELDVGGVDGVLGGSLLAYAWVGVCSGVRVGVRVGVRMGVGVGVGHGGDSHFLARKGE